MADSGSGTPGLQRVATGGLSLGGARAALLRRGRETAAASDASPHYTQATAAYAAGDTASALAAFRFAAEQGHAESQYMLSLLYDEGEGIPRDQTESANWERRAAEQGHAYAQANLSYRHYLQAEYEQAFQWCQRAAHTHLPWAQYNLGLMYRKGEGVEQSDAEAARWYRLAADQDFTEAQRKLAELYLFGSGVLRSFAEAAAWYRRAAVLGDAESQFQLAHLYAVGQGLEQDYIQSRHWTRQAAEQGHEEAKQELARRAYRDS